MEREKKSEIREHPDDPRLMWKCAWCFPESESDDIPPLPKGKIGYSDGICEGHYAIEMKKLMERSKAKINTHPRTY